MLYNYAVVSNDKDNLIVFFVALKKKLRNATTSFVIYLFLSVCSSLCLSGRKNSAPLMDFLKKVLIIFRKAIEKIQVLFKSEKNDGYYT